MSGDPLKKRRKEWGGVYAVFCKTRLRSSWLLVFPQMEVIYCSTPEEAELGATRLFSCGSTIYVDVEGVSLSREGQVCLLQCMGETTPVYVFDLLLLGRIPESLRQILESGDWQKYTWDPRGDADALYHKFGVILQNVVCLQLAELAFDRMNGAIRRHVSGLTRSLARFLPQDLAETVCPIKKMGKDMFNEDAAVFAKRPLTQTLLYYAALDVATLQVLKGVLWDNLPVPQRLWVSKKTRERIGLAFRPEPLPSGCEATVAPDEDHPLLMLAAANQ